MRTSSETPDRRDDPHGVAIRHEGDAADVASDRENDDVRRIRAKLHHLSSTHVFATLSTDEREWLARNVTMITCQAGHVFYTPDEACEVAFILKRGKVDLYRLTSEGRKLVVATLEPHTVFGEMALVGQHMHGCYAESTEDCLVCVLRRADLEHLVTRNPGVALRLLDVLERRLTERESELEALAFQSVPMRLAALLLREMDDEGVVSGYSHQDLADRLGTYRETVSQVLGRFREQGLVVIDSRRIKVLDEVGLRRQT